MKALNKILSFIFGILMIVTAVMGAKTWLSGADTFLGMTISGNYYIFLIFFQLSALIAGAIYIINAFSPTKAYIGSFFLMFATMFCFGTRITKIVYQILGSSDAAESGLLLFFGALFMTIVAFVLLTHAAKEPLDTSGSLAVGLLSTVLSIAAAGIILAILIILAKLFGGRIIGTIIGILIIVLLVIKWFL